MMYFVLRVTEPYLYMGSNHSKPWDYITAWNHLTDNKQKDYIILRDGEERDRWLLTLDAPHIIAKAVGTDTNGSLTVVPDNKHRYWLQGLLNNGKSLQIWVSDGGLTEKGRFKYECRELVAIYIDQVYQYHLKLDSTGIRLTD